MTGSCASSVRRRPSSAAGAGVPALGEEPGAGSAGGQVNRVRGRGTRPLNSLVLVLVGLLISVALRRAWSQRQPPGGRRPHWFGFGHPRGRPEYYGGPDRGPEKWPARGRPSGRRLGGDGPVSGPGGTTVVSASHAFSNLSEVPALVADIAGNGPEAKRPFRLAVNEQPGFLQNSYTASGSVDLQCSLSCFDDPKLATSVGYALGMPPSEVRQLVADPAKDIDFRVEVVLPGQVTTSDAAGSGDGSTLVWSPVLGQATPVVASSKVVDTGRVRSLAIAIGAGAFIVVATAIYVVWSGRRRRRRGGLRFR